MKMAPLQGVKVVDLSKVLAGPLCAQYLGDMGADVIKIEAPEGDETRGWPPFRHAGEVDATGAVFLSANRNKRGIVLDLQKPLGREVIHRMISSADVVLCSFGPGVAERLKVDAATLCDLNPKLVYCNISGFGSVGPMSKEKGYDVILQAFCGMLSITGSEEGGPARSPFSPVDQATGLHALIGILAALFARHSSGKGAVVEASLFDAATGFLGYFLQSYWERGTEPRRVGAGHESLCPYDAFDTADKPLILGVANDGLWIKFCDLAGLGAVRDDERFRTNAGRVANREQTVALVKQALATRTRDEWLTVLRESGIPSSPLHTLGEFSSHPHTAASGMLLKYEHEIFGQVSAVAQPLRINGERTTCRLPPPLRGEHSKAVLLELGYTEQEVLLLIDEGVLVARGQ